MIASIKKIFLYIVALLYISDLPFFFLPFNVRTRFFLGIIGGGIFFLHYLSRLKIKKVIFYNILWLLALLIPFLATIIINDNIDSWGFRAVLNVFVLFAAFLVVYLYKKIDFIDFEKIVKLIINIILLNIIIAILMFIVEPLKQFIFRLQGQGTSAEDAVYYLSSFRLVGIGNFFFYQAGVFCAWGLVLVTYFLKQKTTLRWLLIYLVIFISGIFFARTTFIGFLISLLYYIFPSNINIKKDVKNLFKKIIIFFLISVSLILFFNTFLKDILLKNTDIKMVSHAFEFFINYFESSKLESASTNHLSEMYVYPDNLKTWILGDGRFTAEDGIHYYKGTDVGYLRILFFMGIFGLLVMYFQKIYLLYTTIKLKNYKLLQYKHLIYFLFLLTLILNFKGFTDLDIIIFIFFWYLLLKENRI